MVRENRRSWLDKISRWILGALPDEKAPDPEAPKKWAATASSPKPQQPTQPWRSAQPPEAARPERLEISTPPAQQAGEGLLQSVPQQQPVAPAAPRGNTINQAWKAFALAWSSAGLSDHYFMDREELEQTLAVLDRSFEEELIEWLFQLCTKPEALSDLAGIIERGQVKPTDNIDAIRAFAYVSIAVCSKPRLTPSPPATDRTPTREERETDARSIAERQPEPPSQVPTASLQTAASISRTDGNISLEALELSVRAYNCLKRANIHTLLDLAGRSEEDLVDIKNFGQKSADEVRQQLERLGLSLPFTQEDVLGLRSLNQPEHDSSGDAGKKGDGDIRSLGLSTRTLNCLYRGGIINLPHLLQHTEADLLAFPNLGPTGVQEIKALLDARGFSLLDERSQWQAETTELLEQHQTVNELEEAWRDFRVLIGRQIGLTHPSFRKLVRICADYPDDLASKHLAEILARLETSLDFIGETLSHQHSSHIAPIQIGLDALRDWIASQLPQRSSDAAVQWVNQITKGFTPHQERNWLVYLLRCSGQTLKTIGDALNPPISRERARQMEAKVAKITGIKSAELAEHVAELQGAAMLQDERGLLESWLNQLGRLPIRDDQVPVDTHGNSLWNQVCDMDLKRRSELLNKHRLSIPATEYDFHYQYVVGRGSVGPGYWREFENLKQFVIRHAIALGEPDLMPKQTSFPDAVRGVVTSYGGQSKVAKRIGLIYQGQLVGSDGGRRYWTEERLNQLLLDTNQHHQHDPELMPSYGDILEFFSQTQIADYQDKKPHSAIAALTKMGSLHWSEVAGRFGKRFVSGESQKSVTLSYIKAFVRDLGDHLDSLSPSELFVLFQAQGINRGEKEKFSRTFDALVDAVQSGVVDKDELRSWAENNEVGSINELLELGAELKAESTSEEKEQKLLERRSKKLMEEFPIQASETEIQAADLPTLEPVKILKALDKAADIVENSGTDSDKVEFLKAKAAAKLWDACFKDEEMLISKLKAFPAEDNSYSQEVQQAFIEEYEGARALPIPDAYEFRDLRGHPRDPKLMQRLVAFRLERDFSLLNLSGTGTGKTLSAIYAAQICGCQRLLISCPNGVIESWRRAFSSAFPSANLIIKPDGWELSEVSDGVTVVIVNHERFQDRFAQQLLGFCISYQADMIVIDEIHQSKRRSSDQSSQRRKLMNEFIRISSNINPEVRILGLSATPVINNLYEGRSLLELICQKTIDDVGENIDLNACMNLYQHFVVHGIRMNPGQLSRTKLIHLDIDATPLLTQIIWATKRGNYHDIEQLLVVPKLKSLERCLIRGEKTVIFITYIKNTLRPITDWLAQRNYSFSVYTGEEKEALEEGFTDSLDEFIHGSTEVLVASVQCAGTGVDGLQTVCNRAIFFQLPWTSTEFEQTIGRLDRDGTDFDHIDVYVPLTDIALPNGERWSWCRSKLDRIESKRDIAKAAVDGEIPDAATLISPGEASKYWLNWLERLEQQSQSSASHSS